MIGLRKEYNTKNKQQERELNVHRQIQGRNKG